MIKVYDANNITEAHIVRGMLEANGIDAYVGGYYLQGGVGELAVQGFASVLVPGERAVEARELIDSYENDSLR
jgi:Putative prokaryotic signal transducing protein